jgi:hypothetical protein
LTSKDETLNGSAAHGEESRGPEFDVVLVVSAEEMAFLLLVRA